MSRIGASISLGQLGRWTGGGTPSKANSRFWAQGTIPWVSPKDMKRGVIEDTEDHITAEAVKSSATNIVPAGSVLVVARSGILEHSLPVARAGREVALNQDMKALVPKPDWDPDYIIYALRAFKNDILRKCSKSGTTVANLDFARFLAFEIPAVPLSEQRRIVAKLARILAASKSARDELAHIPKMIARYKRAVLTSAFRGDLTADWRKTNPDSTSIDEFLQQRVGVAAKRRNAPGYGRDERSALIERDADLAGALQAVIEEQALPPSWRWCGIGEVFGVYIGATPSRKEAAYWQGEIPWVSSGEVAFCRISKTAETISDAGFRETSTRLHPRGTVLLGMIGEGKTRGQAAILDIEACNNQNCAAIRVTEAGYPPEYVYWYLYAVYEHTRTAGAGNNQPALNKDRVQRLAIPLAPQAEAVQVVKAIESYLGWLDRLEAEVSSARRLFNRLETEVLTRAFTGELVPGTETSEAPMAAE